MGMVGRPQRELPIRPAFTSWSQCSRNGASIASSLSSSSIAARSAGRSRSASGRATSNRPPSYPVSTRSAMSSSTKAFGRRIICTLDLVLVADARQLQAHERRLRRLAERLLPTGLISSGSVSTRYAPCGKPGCRCHSDPSQLHGPYWQWTTKVNGKTVTRNLNQRQAGLYQEWIANRRRLLAVLAEMEEVSQHAAEILLAKPHLESTPSPMGAISPPAPTRRVTPPLAQPTLPHPRP